MSEASNLPAAPPGASVEAQTAPLSPSDDRFAAGLRGFGSLGILAILAILLTGNVFIGGLVAVPVGAIAHAAFDLAALALIYWNLESAVAHLVFK